MAKHIDGIALFSGGLDSILASYLLQKQGLKILHIHFTSPFFGNAEKVSEWRDIYGIEPTVIDIGQSFVSMLIEGPEHGFGKNLNPCMDCKILQLKTAKKILEETGATFIATGEVLGQRPMSQRRDCLNRLIKRANVDGLLLRPLCAQLLEPTQAELSSIVDRSKLLAISGRGRNSQLELAKSFALKKIPAPGGGCHLTEQENTRRYWQVYKNCPHNDLERLTKDFYFADLGRQLWRKHDDQLFWLAIGRTNKDNEHLLMQAREDDVTFKVSGVPGPLGVARDGQTWPKEILAEAASITAAYCPKVDKNSFVSVSARGGATPKEYNVMPNKLADKWSLPDKEIVKMELKELRKGKI